MTTLACVCAWSRFRSTLWRKLVRGTINCYNQSKAINAIINSNLSMLLTNPLALESCILWSTSKAFNYKSTSNDNLKVHKASALAPRRVSQSVRRLGRLPIFSWLSGSSFNVSWNWCCRLAEKENENAISCTVDIMFLTIQWFFNATRYNLAASLLFTESKVFRKKF